MKVLVPVVIVLILLIATVFWGVRLMMVLVVMLVMTRSSSEHPDILCFYLSLLVTIIIVNIEGVGPGQKSNSYESK